MSLQLTGPFNTGKLPVIAADPVTVTVARRVAPGREAEFLRWADELIAAVREAPGCLGAAVFHPGDTGGEYQIIVRFANGSLLRAWERSTVRERLMEDAGAFVTSARMQRTVGVDEWFEAAAHASPKRPLWRMLLVESAWVYPVSLVMALFVSPWLVTWPLLARVAAGTSLITLTLSLAVGPFRRGIRARRRL